MRPSSYFLPDQHVTEITHRDFEILVKDFLVATGQNLTEINVQHDIKQSANDGTYQIDIRATFEVFGGSQITVLVECKHYNTPIKREKVEILYSRLLSLGANKGILFSTSGFQQGAIDFAKSHGIALIWVIEGRFTYETKSADKQQHKLPPWADIPKYVGAYSYDYQGNSYTTSYLQSGHLEPLSDFLFKENTPPASAGGVSVINDNNEQI